MLSFHGDPAVKATYVARLAHHHEMDEIHQGVGFEIFKGGVRGCAVGCTLDVYDHSRYPVELGLPEWLARLEDRIFEGLPTQDASKFATDFLNVIPVGVSVERVRGKLAVLRHRRDLERLKDNAEPYARQCESAIEGVIRWIENGENSTARSAARSAAWSAAESAAFAAESAAESAAFAWSAASTESAWSAWSTARSAAWSAAESAAFAAAFAHFEWEAENLLHLLSECAPEGSAV
jgi:hypothetical protein